MSSLAQRVYRGSRALFHGLTCQLLRSKPKVTSTPTGGDTDDRPVIIIGAGIVGLTLAYALRKADIPFIIIERDESVSSRPQGWALTVHWALSVLRHVLPPSVFTAAVEDAQVIPSFATNDDGNFLFLNLKTLETKFNIPPNERRRVNREKLRRALVNGLEYNFDDDDDDDDHDDHDKSSSHFKQNKVILWGRTPADILLDPVKSGQTEEVGGSEPGVRVKLDDGTIVSGCMVVGAEGTNSKTREFLVPDGYENNLVPVKFLGVAVDFTPEQVQPLRDIDPLLFQGGHPDTDSFLWFSFLDTPEANGTIHTDKPMYRLQFGVSWPFTAVDHQSSTSAATKAVIQAHQEQEDDGDQQVDLSTNAARLAEMKRRAAYFHPSIRGVIDAIPDTTPVLDIALQDWPCKDWDNHCGRVTLAGDAAHAMTMYRGEAGNHGILDAYKLSLALEATRRGGSDEKSRSSRGGGGPQDATEKISLKQAVDGYEAEMRQRTRPAVELSRLACVQAHYFHELNEHSAIFQKRVIKDLP